MTARMPAVATYDDEVTQAIREATRESAMTLCISALARDGAVVVTDTREALLDQPGWFEDGATKAFWVGGRAIVSAAGAGQWVSSLLREAEWPSNPSAAEVAKRLHGMLAATDGVPEVAVTVTGATQIYTIQRRLIAGAVRWADPAMIDRPYLISGIGLVARALFGAWWRDGLAVDEVAAIAVAAVKRTSERCFYVSPTYRLHVCTAPGGPAVASDRLEARVEEILREERRRG